eukprot:1933117-Amphidinium_carterae.3
MCPGWSFKALDRAGSFDRVLVDAPCSASGLWPRLEQHVARLPSCKEVFVIMECLHQVAKHCKLLMTFQ